MTRSTSSPIASRRRLGSGAKVITKAQRPWGGCIDGMNADGLVASLTAGGSRARGLGFSIILMLRYVLETCSHVDQAIAALSRIPVALSQNVTFARIDPAPTRLCLSDQIVPHRCRSFGSARTIRSFLLRRQLALWPIQSDGSRFCWTLLMIVA